MNIRELRKELKAWGRFWAEKESLQGYASKSVTARCCEVLQTGIWASSDRYLFNNSADNLITPWWIERIDKVITQLPPCQKFSLNKRYIKNSKMDTTERLALLNAELSILPLL